MFFVICVTECRGKEWSADKFVIHWGEFLQREDAKQDSQFNTIRQMYAKATSASDPNLGNNKKNPRMGMEGTHQQSSQKKKRTSKSGKIKKKTP